MTSSEFYIKVASLPLLQGISAEQILNMQERGALRIISMEPEEGEVIMEEQHCNTLTMLLEGSMVCTTKGEDWLLEEEIHAPSVLEEEAMWSLSQRYNHSYRAKVKGKLMVIDRQHMTQIMLHNDIFRLNLLARLSARLERNYLSARNLHQINIREKILKLLKSISTTPTCPKRWFIKMTTLANAIDETRLNVSKTLREMQQEGILSLSRELITIHHIE